MVYPGEYPSQLEKNVYTFCCLMGSCIFVLDLIDLFCCSSLWFFSHILSGSSVHYCKWVIGHYNCYFVELCFLQFYWFCFIYFYGLSLGMWKCLWSVIRCVKMYIILSSCCIEFLINVSCPSVFLVTFFGVKVYFVWY